MQAEKDFDSLSIRIMVDDECRDGLGREHGLALWVSYGGKCVLFDTGQTDLLLKNAASLGIDLSKADAIVISHGHYDHTGGLPSALNAALKAKVYLHPAAIEMKFSKKDSGAKSIGMSDLVKNAVCGDRIVWTSLPTEVLPGMFVTGQVPRTNDFEDAGEAFYLDEDCGTFDEVLDDQTMFIQSAKGLVVVLGCAHAGVINTLDYISKLTGIDKIYAVIGGMHLLKGDSKRIGKTVRAFSRYDVQRIVPLHCTGKEAVERFRNEFGDKCVCDCSTLYC